MKGTRVLLVSMFCAVGGGCADDDATLGTDGSSSGGDTTTESSTSTTTATTSTTTTTTTTTSGNGETGYDPPEAECGNGFVEEGEECDDANLDDGDGCSSECLIRCGLQWEAFELPPTVDSVLDPIVVVSTPDGIVVAAQLQENTADQKGVVSFGPLEGWLGAFDGSGRSSWSVRETAAFDDFNIASVVADSAGDLYVAATVDAQAGGTDIWVGKFSGGDGSSLWPDVIIDAPIADSEDSATDLAVAPDGDVVVSGVIRAGDGDDDVWVGKFAAADGAEAWTSTWSGVGAGNFSTDEAGPLVVASDGTVVVLALEYVSFDTDVPLFLSFPAAGGAPTPTAVADLPIGQQNYTLLDARIDGNDDAYFLYVQNGAANQTFFVDKLNDALTRLWRKTQEDFERMGTDWQIEGIDLTANGDPIVVGDLVNDYELPPEAWNQVWVARLDPAGDEQCFTQQTSTLEGLSPADLFNPEVAASGDEAVVSGNQLQDGDPSLWLGSFRAP